jgi:hypothetical protein
MNHIAQLGRLAAQQQKQAFDVSRIGQQAGQFAGQMANKGLQSPIGQGVLGAGANLYNKMPQGGRDMLSGMAIQNFSRPDDAFGLQRHGFNRDPSLGIGANASTTMSSGTGNTNRIPKSMMQTSRFPTTHGFDADPSGETYYEDFDERVSTMTPGHAGSPWSQVLGGIMGANSQMPTSTYPQGTPVAHEEGLRDSYVEDQANYQQSMTDRIVPRSAFNQQYGDQTQPEPSPAQDYPNNPGGGGPHMDYTGVPQSLTDRFPGASEAGRAVGVRNPAPEPSAEDQVRSLFGSKPPQPSGMMQQLPAPGGPPQGVMQQLPAGPGHQGLMDAFPGAAALGGAAGAINRKPQPSGTMQQLPAGPGHQGLMQRLRDAGPGMPSF